MKQFLKQGSLDQLCGVYSVLNALRLLAPRKMNAEILQEVFDLLVDTLPSEQKLSVTLWQGIDFRAMKALVLATQEYFMEREDVPGFQCDRWPRPVPTEIEGFWQRIKEHTDHGGVAIIRIKERLDHWTVVHRVTPKQLHLADSSHLLSLNLSSCSLDPTKSGTYQIAVAQTLLLSRVEI